MKSLNFPNPQSLEEFDNHKLIAFNYDKASGLCGYIAIHRLKGRYPSFGATRFWNYSSEKDALKDALRLSKTMSYKAALAGLPGGGAKAVLVSGISPGKKRDEILKEYARRVNYLSGKFVTGSDVGLTKEDVKKMRRISPYFVGTKVSPEKFTALGIFHSIKVSLKHVYGSEDMQNISFAIQGVGKIGTELLKLIYNKVRNINIADVDSERIRCVKLQFPKVTIVYPDKIMKKKVNVYSPCALSGCINYKNVHELGCEIVVGGANNQLEDKGLGEVLRKMGILYAPDYVVNAGGLISVYDEFENKKISTRRIRKKVVKIGETLNKIFIESKKKGKSPSEVADRMAEKIFNGVK